jgi:hypothetical protein
MFFKNKKINHNSKTFELGLEVDYTLRCSSREKLIFACIKNYIASKAIYDVTENKDDIPINLVTNTGDLSLALSLIDNQEEYEYTLITFEKTHELIKETLHQWIKKETLYEIGGKSVGSAMEEILIEQESKLDKRIFDKNLPLREKLMTTAVYPSKIFKRFDLFKEKNLTFEEYFELVVRNNYFEKTDISVADDILKSVFDKEEEN